MDVNWRNKLPYLIVFRRSCHLKFCFCTRKGRQCTVRLAPQERDPRFIWGSLFACRPKLSIINSPLMLPCYPLKSSCWHVNTTAGPRSACCPLLPVQFALWNRGRRRQPGSSGDEGRSKQQHIPLSCCLPPVVTLKIVCALFLVLSRSRGNPITGRHTLHSGDCGWHRCEISIASPVQAVSLQRPSWTTGLPCL